MRGAEGPPLSGAHLVVSVDLDEWYHCRWATGSKRSRWPDTKVFFKDYYRTTCPRGELVAPTHRVLDLLDEFGVRATFFVLGEVAGYYPELVRQIHQRGHEIACHGMRHVDLGLLSHDQFVEELGLAKARLEQTVGEAVVGYRAPNLIIEPWVMDVLEELEFRYDSSVCPSRKLLGKYGGMHRAPQNPYRLSRGSLSEPGNRALTELPIASFPLVRIPAATGIMTRVVGRWWAEIALRCALRTGPAVYYFHPYEIAAPPKLHGLSLRTRLFLRRTGPWLEHALRAILERTNAPTMTARDLVSWLEGQNAVPPAFREAA